MVPVVLNGFSGLAMVDTGADSNYIHKSCVKKFGLCIDQGDRPTVSGFTNNVVLSLGCVVANIIVDDCAPVMTRFIVLDRTPADIVLGNSFLSGRAVVDLVNKRAEFCSIVERLSNSCNEGLKSSSLKTLKVNDNCVEQSMNVESLYCRRLSDVNNKMCLKSYSLLPDRETQILGQSLQQYSEIFDECDRQTHFPEVEMNIDVGRSRAVKQKCRSLKLDDRDFVEKEISRLLSKGVITKSCSEWASPIVVVSKKGGKKRLCVDYRRLNTVTIGDAYPLPVIEQLLSNLRGRSYYSVLDLKDGFHHLRISEKDRSKTAFITPFGLFEYVSAPFGLKNTPSMYQRCMNEMLGSVSDCYVYVDDIVIVSDSFTEHMSKLNEVLSILKHNNASLSKHK